MKNFSKLKDQQPELAKTLEGLTKEELLEHYSIEVFEKNELAEYKEENEHVKCNLEHIINLGIQWLKKNRKDKHHIYINKDVARLIYTNTETEFI